MGKILFSPIGNSDPIRGGYDGAWLHICRHYRPAFCEIFLTAEMCRKDETEDIYAKTLALLNNRLFGTRTEDYIALRKVKQREIVDAHSLEIYFPLFKEYLTALHAAHPEDELLVNISSGTPGIKNTLMCLYHLLPFPIRLIQVSNPNYDRKPEESVGTDYNVELEWEMNCDNEENAPNRCTEQHMENLYIETRMREIKAAVNDRRYLLALNIVKEVKGHVKAPVITAIEGALKRSRMFTAEAGTLLSQAGWELGDTIRRKASTPNGLNAYICMEYAMTMETDLIHGEYAEYLRKLTPLFCDICNLLLLRQGFDVNREGVDRNGKWRIDRMRDETINILESAFQPFRDGTSLAASNMLPLIREKCPDEIYADARVLRSVEENARNIAAHEIAAVDEKWIKQKTDHSPQQIQQIIRRLIDGITDISTEFSKRLWKSYEEMNAFICSLISR